MDCIFVRGNWAWSADRNRQEGRGGHLSYYPSFINNLRSPQKWPFHVHKCSPADAGIIFARSNLQYILLLCAYYLPANKQQHPRIDHSIQFPSHFPFGLSPNFTYGPNRREFPTHLSLSSIIVLLIFHISCPLLLLLSHKIPWNSKELSKQKGKTHMVHHYLTT